MDFFWGNVFEYFKDRRVAGVFFGTLMALGALLVAGFIAAQVICAFNLEGYAIYALPVLALVFFVQLVRGIRRTRARSRERYKISPMSRDELTKARSKLLKR